MSEHQVYDFIAVDRPLTAREMKELRAISTRAEITARGFSNEYRWGDLKAEPKKLLARYFDAFQYAANWGTRQVMIRLPADRLAVAALKPYVAARRESLTRSGSYYIFELIHEPLEGYDDVDVMMPHGDLIALRTGLLYGDLRLPYLAWLAGVQSEDADDTAREPPVPAGLNPQSGPLAGLIEFMGIDEALLAAAAEASPAEPGDPAELRRWLTDLPLAEKDRWLLRATEQPDQPIGLSLLAMFHSATHASAAGVRTAGQLLARADAIAAEWEREAEEEEKREAKRAAAARRKRLQRLADAPDRTWAQLDRLVAARKYKEAVPLACDLHDALKASRPSEFEEQLAALKQRRPSSPGFFTKLQHALNQRP